MRPSAIGLRVLSMNLANGRARLSGLATLLEELAPDVVATQEMSPPQADLLGRLLPYGKLDPALDHTGMGIALRHPAVTWQITMLYRAAHVAEIRLAGREGHPEVVEVVNVHFAAPHMLPLRLAQARRRSQLRTLLTHLDATRRPRAVVGDLNATPSWPVYRRLTSRLSDAALEAARRRGARPARTWGPFPGSPRLLRIDHALVEALRVLDVAVHPLPGSDHSALLVDIAHE
jgi:endonuclease/exonuclease/phosphatase family metal-dependent hydrolase